MSDDSRSDRFRARQEEFARRTGEDPAQLAAGDPLREGETYEQFHTRHTLAQTTALRQSARDLCTIKLILQVFFWVSVAGIVILLISISQASRY